MSAIAYRPGALVQGRSVVHGQQGDSLPPLRERLRVIVEDLGGEQGDRWFTRGDVMERHAVRYGEHETTEQSVRSYLSSMVAGNTRKPHTTRAQPLERDGHRYRLLTVYRRGRPSHDLVVSETFAQQLADRHRRRRLEYARAAVHALGLTTPFDYSYLPASPYFDDLDVMADGNIVKVDAIVLDRGLSEEVSVTEGIGRAALLQTVGGFEKYMAVDPAAIEAFETAGMLESLAMVAPMVSFGTINASGRWRPLHELSTVNVGKSNTA